MRSQHLALVSAFYSVALAGPIVSIQPSPASVSNGATFSVSVNTLGVTDLYAFQFDVGFDPAILSADAIAEGTFLSSAGPTFFLVGSIDNINGIVAFAANSLIGGVSGVSGNGELSILQFTALGAGLTSITLQNVQLLDSNLNPIDFVASDGVVFVQAVPEPATSRLIGLSLLIGFTQILRGRFQTQSEGTIVASQAGNISERRRRGGAAQGRIKPLA